MKWYSYNSHVPITVIPCCTDMQLFSITSLEEKEKARNLLGLSQNNLIISYLGSLGAWYMLNEMLAFFKILKKSYSDAIFLFITHSDPEEIVKKLEKFALSRNDVMIIKASRKEVPVFTKASDINISFIQPVYSKISSSPTKLGEVLALGIPVISNSGVGDVAEIIKNINAGLIIEKFNDDEYKK
ncbi:MAG: glycosyltransferase [Chitinophagaceae bacterium]|nr:glycosyltransferase [Chitinophagaceae bacterium]